MSIKNPSTYGEWYFAQKFSADKAFDESIEQAVSPLFKGIMSAIPDISELPSGVEYFIRSLAEPSSPGLGGFLTSAAGEFTAEILKDALAPAMSMLRRYTNKRGRETWLTSNEAITLSQRKKIPDEFFYELTAAEGYEDIVADFKYDSMRPYPTIPDLMLWGRYHGNPDEVREAVSDKFDVDPMDFDIWHWLSLEKLNTLQAQSLLKRGLLSESEFYDEIAKIGWSFSDRPLIADLSYTLPNSMLLVQGNLFARRTNDTILADIIKADIHPQYAQTYLDAVLTKPASQDIIAYELRRDPSLSVLDEELTRIGIHPAYTGLYRELAYQIPPVADIITMAVREAFTPDVAERFGQYEDFPADFEKYAAMKGLSPEWSKRYWAAHWNLPSPQQGFEMLHRGVIDQSELNMLLRALDVMPFWRDKLTQIAYRPLTRVDVRRMYREGVLDEKEVYESYLNQGYSEPNAERMALFTVRQTLSSLAKFTSGDIVKAYSKRMISEGEARSLLVEIGIRSADASYIVSTAEHKRVWAFTEQQIRGIRNLYKKKEYSENDARGKLAGLNLPSDQIEILMEQWYYDVKVEPTATWSSAQTLAFFKKDLITESRARKEFALNGFDVEHIDIYIRSVK